MDEDILRWPFKIINDNGKPTIEIEHNGEVKRFAPEEVCTYVLTKMKEIAETYLGETITDAVVTVPAYFNDSQRQATKDAGAIAGLNILRIVNEPTAAALAYGLDKNLKGEKTVLTFDLGGGTLDVSILHIDEESEFTTLGTVGDTNLGGEDFDNRLVSYFAAEFQSKFSKDLTTSARSLRKLRTGCERVKRTLSACTEATIEIDGLFEGIDFFAKITRAQFEEMCMDLFRSTIRFVEKALHDAKFKIADIDDIVMIGGSTRIPKLQTMLQEFFKGKTLNVSINPDEAVAYGAAMQAAILSGDTCDDVKDVFVVDVTPISLGIETAGGVMAKIIHRNTTIPCCNQQVLTTYTNNQQAVTMQIYEEERLLTKDNNLLGVFILNSIPSSRRGVPKIEVTFHLDENGILNVTAKNNLTGNSERFTITTDAGHFTKAGIQRMICDVDHCHEDDKKQRERTLIRNSLESYIYSKKLNIGEAADSLITTDEKKSVEDKCSSALPWLDEHSSVEKKILELLQGLQKIYSLVMTK